MMKIRIIFLFLVFYAFWQPTSRAERLPFQLQIIGEDQSGIRLRITFDEPNLNDNNFLPKLIDNSFLFWQDSIFINPLITKSFVPLTKHVSIQLMKTEFRTILLDDFKVPVEVAIDTVGQPPQNRHQSLIAWKELASKETALVKIYPGESVFCVPVKQVQFYPIQFGETENRIKFYHFIEVKLKFDYSSALIKFVKTNISPDEDKFFKETIINYRTLKNILQQTVPNFTKIKSNLPYDVRHTCNLLISKDGWYRITYADLKQAGVPVDFLDAKKVQLFLKGSEIPIYFPGDSDRRFRPGEFIEFWGEKNRNTDFVGAEDMYYNPYSLTSVYILTWNRQAGLRYGTQNSISSSGNQPVKLPAYFQRTIHIEQDRSYNRLGWAPAGSIRDHWFDRQIGSGELVNIPIQLPVAYPYSLQPIRLTLWFHGVTTRPHKVDVFLNQQFIGSGNWFGAENYKFEASVEDIGGMILNQEDHQLTIVNRSNEELDFILYNWLEIDYPQAFEAKDNFLLFTRPQNEPGNYFQFRLSEFTRPDIELFKINAYKVHNSQIVESTDSLNQTTYQVRFRDESYSTGDRYIALTAEKKLSPDTLFLYQCEDNLRSSDNQADYLIITHSKFANHPKLDEFVQFREKDYSVKVLTMNDLNQQFNFGNIGPFSIKKFLQFTQKKWVKPAPSYVLLIGDGNYNYRSPASMRENYVPVYHYQTYKFGAAVSDAWYITGGNDEPIPTLSIGRWPVRETDKLDILIDKTITYEKSSTDPAWNNNLLWIATDQVFRQQTAELLDQVIPRPYFSRQFHTSPVDDPFFGDTEKLIELWNEGASYINFRGHGGGAVWADNLLFRFEDIERLNNQYRLPFVTSMTCFTCAFDGGMNLGESLLLYENGGAVAITGSAGVGWIWNDFYLLREITAEMFSQPGASLGHILTNGKRHYGQKYFTPQRSSDLHQYNLLGDPALRLKLPWQEINLSATPQKISPGELITCKMDLPVSAGVLQIKVQNDEGITVLESMDEISTTNRFVQVQLPQNASSGLYFVKIYAYSEDGSWLGHGSVPVSVDGITVQKITIHPAHPTVNDTIKILADCLGFQPGESNRVFFVYDKQKPDSLNMSWLPDENRFQTVLPPGFIAAGDQLQFFISVSADSQYIKSDWQAVFISHEPDFKIIENSLGLMNTDDDLLLYARIRNNSNARLDSVQIEFRMFDYDSGLIYLGQDFIALGPYEQSLANISWTYPFGDYQIQVKADPNHRFTPKTVSSAMKLCSNQMKVNKSNVQDGRYPGSLPFLNFSVKLPPRDTSDILKYDFSEGIQTSQKQLQMKQLDSWPSPVLYFGHTDSGENISLAISMEFKLDSLDREKIFSDSLSLFQYYPDEHRWAKILDQQFRDSTCFCSTNRSGYFAWFQSADHKPPQIRILTRNRGFYDGGFVQKNPSFTIRLDDINGAHPNPNLITALLNGQPILTDESEIRHNYRNGSQMIQLSLSDLMGENHLKVAGYDCSGNQSEFLEITFNVDDQVDLIPLGNYPNPFVDLTIFAYELSSTVDNFTLKIYTSSGKLIRTIRDSEVLDDPNPCEVGYHEIPWEGVDDDGEEVANGVYFYQYSVTKNGKSIRKRGKIARLQ